jgi:hypothetical protein
MGCRSCGVDVHAVDPTQRHEWGFKACSQSLILCAVFLGQENDQSVLNLWRKRKLHPIVHFVPFANKKTSQVRIFQQLTITLVTSLIPARFLAVLAKDVSWFRSQQLNGWSYIVTIPEQRASTTSVWQRGRLATSMACFGPILSIRLLDSVA